jgi:hypothetical protein
MSRYLMDRIEKTESVELLARTEVGELLARTDSKASGSKITGRAPAEPSGRGRSSYLSGPRRTLAGSKA